MALSGAFNHDFASYFRLRIEWTATQSQANNTSTITSKLYLISLSQYSTINTSSDRRAWVTIHGVTNYSAYDPNKLDLAGNQKKLMHTYTRTVGHDSNGRLVANLGGGIDWNLNINGYTGSTVTISGTGTLTDIPQTVEPPPVYPPSDPVISYPTTRITVDNSVQLKWSGGTDPQGQAVTHQVAYKNTSSAAWVYSSWFTNNNSTKTYTIDTTNWNDSTTAKMAVRTKNTSGLSSGWDYSPEFTIENAVAPLAPTPTAPNSAGTYPPELNTRFSWALNGSGGQTHYTMDYRKAGVATWTSTGLVASTRQYHDVPANTLTAGQYEWRIKIRGTSGLDSPWSAYKQFEILAPTTAPTITRPTVNQVVNNNLIQVEWEFVTDQEAYQLQLLDEAVVVFDETINSSLSAGYITYAVEHLQTYTVKVRTKKFGVWSPYTSRIISAAIALPDAAIIDLAEVTTPDPDRGAINISYTPPVTKLNVLPSFTSGQWANVNTASPTTAWSTTFGGTTMSIRVPAQPGKLYLATAVLNTGYRLVLATYNAANAVTGFTSMSSFTNGETVQNNIMAGSDTTSILYSIEQSTGAAAQPVSNPLLTDTTVDGTYPAWEAGSDTGFTNPVAMEIHRKLYGTDEWIKVAGDLALTVGGYEDITVGSGLLYEYKIRTIGANGLTNDTAVFESQVAFMHAFLHDAHNPHIFFRIFLEDAREEELDVEGELQYFSGRKLPIREYGVHETHRLDIEWVVDSSDELNDIKEQVKRRTALLYRDNAGRRFFATTNGVQATDRQIIGHNMSMTLVETDFKEGVD